jgi:hypothetical protein
MTTGATQPGTPPEPDPPGAPGPLDVTPAAGPTALESWGAAVDRSCDAACVVLVLFECFAPRVGSVPDDVGVGVPDVTGAEGAEDDGGAWLGTVVGWGVEDGPVVGLDVGVVRCDVGAAPGAALAFPCCHDSAT